jgi:hypothetical protein
MDLTAFNSYKEINDQSENNRLRSALDNSSHTNEDKHLIGESLPTPTIDPSGHTDDGYIGVGTAPAREDHSHPNSVDDGEPSSLDFKDNVVYTDASKDNLYSSHLSLNSAMWTPKVNPVIRKRGFIVEDLQNTHPDVTMEKHYDVVGLVSYLWDTVSCLIKDVQELEAQLKGKQSLDGVN